MQLPLLTLPRAVPMVKDRPPQETVPQTKEQRELIRTLAQRYVAREKPVIPLSLEELRKHAAKLIAYSGLDSKYAGYVAVVINGEANREALASVPYDRRLLLLPKCLRVEDRCPAPFDEFGLLCKQCGLCTIQDLQNEAEKLGYAVLTAEGSALVMAIISTGKIDAILGVSCLSVLERAFPYMESAAIPGVAIPLLNDDCKDTGVDVEWVWEYIHLSSDDRTHRMDLDAVRDEVDTWFTQESLAQLMGSGDSESERIGRAWLAKSGKRWRPFLAACAWKALQDDQDVPFPTDLKKLAVAVECFHKASLIHDDIEDGDDLRYGEATVHAEHGVPVALNVGDLLLGEGYRLIAETDATPAVRALMIKIAAEGHRALCLGQGAELTWANNPRPLTQVEVADIHRRKTAPAFEVALRLGAAFAGADAELHQTLTAYSEALGIAYQIHDDIDDLTNCDGDDITAARPAFPLAEAYSRAKGKDRELLEGVWRRAAGFSAVEAKEVVDRLGATERSRQMMESYKEQAVRTLEAVDSPSLKGLLRRVVSKIFGVEVKGWCSEFEARNAPSGSTVAETAG
ncbi:MAG: polyprenyl synthetase family protein [Fimbriiglobus sp.]|jgi:geranylgeranyl pyrophosphate synthase|nr:polyprenyl synthetase family protein [Fimbriiglobus sp.]